MRKGYIEGADVSLTRLCANVLARNMLFQTAPAAIKDMHSILPGGRSEQRKPRPGKAINDIPGVSAGKTARRAVVTCSSKIDAFR